jgi:hypothetical protein
MDNIPAKRKVKYLKKGNVNKKLKKNKHNEIEGVNEDE